MLCIVNVLSATTYSQTEKLNIVANNQTMESVLQDIKSQTCYEFVYRKDILESGKNINLEMRNSTVSQVLNKLFQSTGLVYEIVDNVIVIRKVSDNNSVAKPQKTVIKGIVTDANGNPLPGVSIVIKGTTVGTSSDIDGNFKLELLDVSSKTMLVFSFIGMKTKEVSIQGKKELKVKLVEDKEELDEVVVTGYSKVSKESFTGNVVSINKEDLLKVSKTNVIAALQAFDPSFRIEENNMFGSDPNAMPEMYIRGRSGIGVKELDRDALNNNNPNLPLFIMDGFQVSVQKVYDFDPTRIESITILKDAASTAIYGSRAANGVVVITTTPPKAGELSVSYNMTGTFSAPDLSDYNLMNAAELLETERVAGFYETYKAESEYARIVGAKITAQQEYNAKMNNLLKGVDTYWLSKPVRSVLNTKHSLFIEGGSQNLRFGVDANFNNEAGVMKESYRNRKGIGFYLDFRKNKFQIRNHVSYNITESQDSPFGSFSEYAQALPYDTYKNEEGIYHKELKKWHREINPKPNPLYESTLQSYSIDEYEELINNTNMNYYINDYLHIKGQFSITKNMSNSEDFIDPKSARNANLITSTNMSSGQKMIKTGKDLTWDANVLLGYNRLISNHNINFTFGINAKSTNYRNLNSEYRGFPSGTLNSINYAEGIYLKPTIDEKTTRLFGSLATLNYTYNEILLMDLSCRLDGSSEFGSENKFAPFWASGLGINLHNCNFLQDHELISKLKFRASYGSSGKVNFPPYVANTTYEVLTDEWYMTGFGVSLKALGNNELTWEKTNTLDCGFELGLFNDRFFVKASYYNKNTVDMVTQVTIPTSAGFRMYYDNMGEVENKGYEVMMRTEVLRTKDLSLSLHGNLAHNKNRLVSISDALKAYNERVDDVFKGIDSDKKVSKPLSKYKEGASQTAIYGVRSLGIDPATGDEIFLNRDGEITKVWNVADQVVIGDREPTAQGSFGFNFRYKNFTLFSSFMYKFGGQEYNTTLVQKVENAQIYHENVDRRVFSERWKKPGDISMYKRIQDASDLSGTKYTRPTSRFIQDNNLVSLNSLTLGYDFRDQDWLKKAHIGMLRVELGSNNLFRISTVRQERGTSYPFARNVNFSVKASF